MADEDSTGGYGAAAGRSGGRRRRPRSARRRALTALVWTTAGMVLLGGLGLGFVYFKLNGNISGIDINAALGTDRPEDTGNGSMDILVMGSDSRSGDNARFGGDDNGTARADTAMIVHVNKDRDKASIVSIPRDTMVQRPSCDKGEGKTAPAARQAMFNESYQVGGPACAVKTVESMTDIRMDHYIEVDFSGFKNLIDTLGGVDVTVRKPIKDKDSHLDLSAGTHSLNGEQSLGLVRTRHAVGDGSDLGRIQLQQAFIRALMDQVNSIGLFGNPKKLFDLADTATSSLTTDSELDSVGDLTGLAKTLKGIKSDDIRMVTMPVEYDPANPNRVLPMERKSRQVWTAVKHDRPIPKSATKNTAGDESDIDGVVR
ncbi:LytR family transcriptional regulator [Streptomyces armeniacus]|uniref:LytR family transcriptional regulator n=1 Tax=Streptomyces armeniacus TaxID=83291 RepID=A0A345XST5_9ACTN|nr:LCP family protein [Streptomyces armeniacus]AXK34701.1 LytR family transcriptional regulator [Streptomyces armeniacus]